MIGDRVTAAQMANKVRAKFPELQSRVPAGVETEAGQNKVAKFDVSRADKVFGSNWISGLDSTIATVEDILAYEASHPEEQIPV